MSHSKALIIFIRKPELGKVKTRLAKEVGAEKALDIYTQLLEHTKKVALEVSCDRLLFYEGEIDQNDSWSSEHFKKFKQKGKDLGQKMEHAFDVALESYESVVIIGSDCAELNKNDIETAFYELDEHDVVIGPARDGGYYLLGVTDPQLFLFDNMPWSEDNLLEETIFAIQDRGLMYALLKTKSDIDFKEDWEAYKHLLDK